MEVQSTGLLEEADFLSLVLDEVPAHVHAEIWVGAAPDLAPPNDLPRGSGVMTDVLESQTGARPVTRSTRSSACPECGTVSTVHADRRLATDFCPTCDYPLFWARPSVAAAGVDGPHRRRPAPRARAPPGPRCPRRSRARRAPS